MRLRATIDSLMMPKLVKVGLEAHNNRTRLGAPYKTVREACALVEASFEYVCTTPDSLMILRKRK